MKSVYSQVLWQHGLSPRTRAMQSRTPNACTTRIMLNDSQNTLPLFFTHTLPSLPPSVILYSLGSYTPTPNSLVLTPSSSARESSQKSLRASAHNETRPTNETERKSSSTEIQQPPKRVNMRKSRTARAKTYTVDDIDALIR